MEYWAKLFNKYKRSKCWNQNCATTLSTSDPSLKTNCKQSCVNPACQPHFQVPKVQLCLFSSAQRKTTKPHANTMHNFHNARETKIERSLVSRALAKSSDFLRRQISGGAHCIVKNMRAEGRIPGGTVMKGMGAAALGSLGLPNNDTSAWQAVSLLKKKCYFFLSLCWDITVTEHRISCARNKLFFTQCVFARGPGLRHRFVSLE